MPARGKICKPADGRVHLEDTAEAEDDAILDPGSSPAEELPAVIVFVVDAMENGLVALGDLTERDDDTIRGLVERPVVQCVNSAGERQHQRTARSSVRCTQLHRVKRSIAVAASVERRTRHSSTRGDRERN
jgi:hypothetical protein